MFNVSIASQSFQSAESQIAADGAPSQDFIARLLAGLPGLYESCAVELADEMLDRAVAYDESQPSYAADLRAAATRAHADADAVA